VGYLVKLNPTCSRSHRLDAENEVADGDLFVGTNFGAIFPGEFGASKLMYVTISGGYPMRSHLVKLEQEALALKNAGKKEEAAQLYSAIVTERPDWEHGLTFYNLAGCLEDLGQLEQAEKSYQSAIEYGPSNPIIWGGYASFLYLHGDPKDAMEAHLKLLSLERASSQPDTEEIEHIKVALVSLADKLGMSREDLNDQIGRAL